MYGEDVGGGQIRIGSDYHENPGIKNAVEITAKDWGITYTPDCTANPSTASECLTANF